MLHVSGSSAQCGPTPVKSPPTSCSLVLGLAFCDWSRSSSPTMTSSNTMSRNHRVSLRIERHAILFDFVLYLCRNSSPWICFSSPIKDSSTSVIDESSRSSSRTFSYLSWLVMLVHGKKKWRQRLKNNESWQLRNQKESLTTANITVKAGRWPRRTCVMPGTLAKATPEETTDVWGH